MTCSYKELSFFLSISHISEPFSQTKTMDSKENVKLSYLFFRGSEIECFSKGIQHKHTLNSDRQTTLIPHVVKITFVSFCSFTGRIL